MSNYKFQDIQKLATQKLQELLSEGYTLCLDGDGSYGNNLTVHIEKDDERYEFALKDELITNGNHGRFNALVLKLTRMAEASSFPSKRPEDVMFSKCFFVLAEGRSFMYKDAYFTDDGDEAIAARELSNQRYARRHVNVFEKILAEVPSDGLMKLINQIRGYKRADADELVVIRKPYGYIVRYHDRDEGLEFKFPKHKQ